MSRHLAPTSGTPPSAQNRSHSTWRGRTQEYPGEGMTVSVAQPLRQTGRLLSLRRMPTRQSAAQTMISVHGTLRQVTRVRQRLSGNQPLRRSGRERQDSRRKWTNRDAKNWGTWSG